MRFYGSLMFSYAINLSRNIQLNLHVDISDSIAYGIYYLENFYDF